MQWRPGKNAGFSNADPWLPVASNSSQVNVETELHNPNSIYSWYRSLLKLRHENAALRDGDYIPLESGNRNVLAFARKARDGSSVLVIMNMSGTNQSLAMSGFAAWLQLSRVLLASPTMDAPKSSRLGLAPYAVLIGAGH